MVAKRYDHRTMFRRLRELFAALTTPEDNLSGDPTASTPERYALLSDSELSAIIADVGRQYTPTARQVAQLELANRSITVGIVDIESDRWLLDLGNATDDDAPDELTFEESPDLRAAVRNDQETPSLRSREALKRLADEYPRSVEPLLHYVQALRPLGHDCRVVALLERLPILRRKSLAAAALADLAFEQSDIRRAIRWYAVAIAAASKPSWVPLLRLAGIYRAAQLTDAAAAMQAAANSARGNQAISLTSEWMRQASAQTKGTAVQSMLNDLWDAYLASRVRNLRTS